MRTFAYLKIRNMRTFNGYAQEMISDHDLIDLQLDSIFGHTMALKIKDIVNQELEQGNWREGYDIAVTSGPLDSEEAKERDNESISPISRHRRTAGGRENRMVNKNLPTMTRKHIKPSHTNEDQPLARLLLVGGL